MDTAIYPPVRDDVIYLNQGKVSNMADYQKRIPFTKQQQELLMSNPYTAKVSAHRLIFTLEFKKFAMRELQTSKCTNRMIFEKAGYDTELLGHERMKSLMRLIKAEAASPEGLREPKEGTREQNLERKLKEDLTKKKTDTAIRELQERVNHLEQQVEFLKKISSLRKKPK